VTALNLVQENKMAWAYSKHLMEEKFRVVQESVKEVLSLR
jgi:hypothetical protein